jgi:hypothetical protein
MEQVPVHRGLVADGSGQDEPRRREMMQLMRGMTLADAKSVVIRPASAPPAAARHEHQDRMTRTNPLPVALAFLLLGVGMAPSTCADAAADLRARGLTVTEKDGAITALAGPFQGLGEEGVAAIAGQTALTTLNLSGAAGMITDAFIARIAALGSIRDLVFNGADVSDAGMRQLAGLPHLRSLTLFHPSRGRGDFTGAGIAALATLPDFERLTVAGGTVGDAAIIAIAALPHLRDLRLWHNQETVDGLARLTSLTQLRTLTLGQRLAGRDATPPSLCDAALAAIAGISSLEELSLQQAHLTIEALSGLKKLAQLKRLTASQIDLPAADVERLRAALPGVTIAWTVMSEQEAATQREKLKL